MYVATASCTRFSGPPADNTVPIHTDRTSTLYDVITALQTLFEPDHDEILVALVTLWLHCGYLRWPEHATIAVNEPSTWRL